MEVGEAINRMQYHKLMHISEALGMNRYYI